MNVVYATTADDVFQSADGPIRYLMVRSNLGEVRLDSRYGQEISIYGDTREPDWIAKVNRLGEVVERYLTPIPRWNHWRRYPVVTNVPAAEHRDNLWKLRIGVLSSVVGGIFGFLGGLISSGVVGKH